eukprot:10556923-Lingulodinium_polyedra.AAC.1
MDTPSSSYQPKLLLGVSKHPPALRQAHLTGRKGDMRLTSFVDLYEPELSLAGDVAAFRRVMVETGSWSAVEHEIQSIV